MLQVVVFATILVFAVVATDSGEVDKQDGLIERLKRGVYTTPPSVWQTNTPSGNHVTLPGNHGFFSSPGYPGLYPNDEEFVWQIGEKYLNQSTTIHFKFFDLERCDCFCDSLTITPSNNMEPTRSFCGSDLPNAYGLVSTSSSVTVTFKSDSSMQFGGFYAEYFVNTPVTQTHQWTEPDPGTKPASPYRSTGWNLQRYTSNAYSTTPSPPWYHTTDKYRTSWNPYHTTNWHPQFTTSPYPTRQPRTTWYPPYTTKQYPYWTTPYHPYRSTKWHPQPTTRWQPDYTTPWGPYRSTAPPYPTTTSPRVSSTAVTVPPKPGILSELFRIEKEAHQLENSAHKVDMDLQRLIERLQKGKGTGVAINE